MAMLDDDDDDDDLFDPREPALGRGLTAPARPKPSNKIVHQPPGAQWSLTRLPEVDALYQSAFKKPLPLTVRGQGSVHNRWGYDHRSSADVSINPSTPEGQQFIEGLKTANVPFLAFSSAIPGVASGPHIHLGFPSHRTQQKFNVGSQNKSQSVASDDLFDADADLFDAQPQAEPARPATGSAQRAKLPRATSRVVDPDSGEELKADAPKPIEFTRGEFPDSGERLTGVDELRRQKLMEAPPQSQILSREYTGNLGHEGGSQHSLSKAALRALGLNEQLADVYAESTGRPLLSIENARPDRQGNFRFTMPKQTVDFLNAWASGLAEGGVEEGLRRAAAINVAGREDVKQSTQAAQQAAAQDVTEAEAATRRGVESPFIRGVTSGAAPVAQAIGTVLPESLGGFERKARVLRAAGEQADIERPLTGTGEQIKAGLGAAVPTAMEFAVTGPLKAAQLPVLGALGGFTPEERAQGALQGAATHVAFALPGMLAPNITGTAEKILAGGTMAAVPATEAAIRGESIPRAIAESLPYAALPFLHGGSEPERPSRVVPETRGRVNRGPEMAAEVNQARGPVEATEAVGMEAQRPPAPSLRERLALPLDTGTGRLERDAGPAEPRPPERTPNAAQATADAAERFIQGTMREAGISREDAAKVLDRYRQENIVTLDPAGERFDYSQPAFATPDVIRRVASLEESALASKPTAATETTAAGFKSDLSLSQYVRKMGGIVPGEMYRGELDRLRAPETGTTGLINQHAKQGNIRQTADIMMQSANDAGFRDPHTGQPFENPGDFLYAIERDVAGDKIRVRTGDDVDWDAAYREHWATQEAEYRQAEAAVSFLESGRGAELFDKLTEGRGTDAERTELLRLARDAGADPRDIESLIGEAELERGEAGPATATPVSAAVSSAQPEGARESGPKPGSPGGSEQRQPIATSAQKTQMARDRAALDLPELPEAERKAWQQSLDNAVARGLDKKADLLADEVQRRPRSLNDEETAGLVLRAQELKNEHARVMREIGAATDSSDIATKATERDVIEAAFDKVSQAAKLSGTEKGRALAAQKLTINQDYDLVSVLSRAKAAKGRELSSTERAEYEQLVAKTKALEGQLAELRSEGQAKAEARSVDKFIREQSVKIRRAQRQQTKATLQNERESIKQQIADLTSGTSVKEFLKSEKGGFDPEHAIDLSRLLTSLARNYIESGIVKADALVDAVHNEVKDITRLTKREVSDLISGYGRVRQPKADATEKKLNEIKAILAATSGRADVLEKSTRPLRRGQQRDKPTEDQRRALRELQDAMKEQGPALAERPYNRAREQATPLDKAKSTARNRIEQLRKWIDDGRKEVQGKTLVIPDAELVQLRTERDGLERAARLLDDPAADQRTIERRVSELNSSLKETRERIQSGRLEPATKEGASAVWSEEIGRLERERRALRGILSDMRNESARVRREAEQSQPAEFYGADKTWSEFDAEAKRILDRRNRLEETATDLERQLATDNVTAPPEPKPERMPTEQEFRLERRVNDARERIAQKLLNDGETTLGRLARRVGDVLGLYRAIETSFDLSWALRQGKIGLARHPTFWSRAFIEQFKGLSNDKYFRAAREIENDPDFRYLNRFGLETPSVDSIRAGAPLHTRAEEFQSSLAHRIPGLRQSEQIYNIGLDTLRVMWAKHDLQMLRKAGFSPERPTDVKVFQEAMQSINDATGRTNLERLIPGKVGQAANRATPAINQMTYAIRFWASRLKVLSSPLDPRMYPQPDFSKPYYESLPRVQRVEAWKRLFAFYGLWGAQAAAMKYLLGFDLETDPDSADFGKLRRGKRVYDLSAGTANHLRFAARMAKRIYESKSGKERPSGANAPIDVLGQYLRSKEAPVPSRVHDVFLSRQTKEGYGTDFKGEPVYLLGKPGSGFFGRLTSSRAIPRPLSIDDAIEAYNQLGWSGVAGSLPAATLGEGVQTYPKREDARQKRRQLRERMTDSLRRGDSVDLDSAIMNDEITEADRRLIRRNAKLSEQEARFDAYIPSTALDRYERMDAGQQDAFRGIMETKAYSLLHSDSLTQRQKDAFAQRIETLGITPQDPNAPVRRGFRSRLTGFKSAFRELSP